MPPATSIKPTPPRALVPQERTDLEAIHSTIDRMRAFTPTDPYVLTIPQDVEPRYHHSYAFQTRQWLEHTPFDAHEHESSQYQTFVFHEPGKEMYMLHNSWRAENSNSGGNGVKNAEGEGKSTTPKKKISLDTYKKKQSGATPDVKELEQVVRKPAAKAPVKGPVERIKADEEVLAGVDAMEEEVLVKEEGKGLKRKREDSLTKSDHVKENQEEQNDHVDGEEEPAGKKARTTPPPQEKAAKEDKSEKSEEPPAPAEQTKESTPPPTNAVEDEKLPPKLSPPPSAPEHTELPPKLSPALMPSLPDRLSPTIPENITATLKVRSHYRSTSRGSNISVFKDAPSRNLTPPRSKAEGGTLKKSPRNGFRANSSSPAVRSDAEERGRPLTSVPPRVKTPDVASEESSDEIAVAKSKKQTPLEGRPRKIVVLEIPEAQRETARRILKMKPNPNKKLLAQQKVETEYGAAKPSSDQRHRERRDTNAKGVAKRVVGASANGVVRTKTGSELKRTREEEDTEQSDETSPPVKKKKKAMSNDTEMKKSQQPSTPEKQNLLSPSSAQRPTTMAQQTTPGTLRKDVLSAAMKRELSSESHIETPTAKSASPPDVMGNNTSLQHGANGTLTSAPTGPSRPSNKTPKQQVWEAEKKRLSVLGRDLKHAASAHLNAISPASSDTSSKTEQRLAAIKSLESLLTYMLAFTCSDEAARAANPKSNPDVKVWRTLTGFYSFVKRFCDAFPALLGLAGALGVVFNAHILDLTTQNPHDGLSRDALIETQGMVLKAANEAEAKLDVDTLLSTFPRTWKARTKGGEKEVLEPGKGFAGGFQLPIGVQTSPVNAVRASYAMLEEWIEGVKGLEYEMRLKLRT